MNFLNIAKDLNLVLKQIIFTAFALCKKDFSNKRRLHVKTIHPTKLRMKKKYYFGSSVYPFYRLSIIKCLFDEH